MSNSDSNSNSNSNSKRQRPPASIEILFVTGKGGVGKSAVAAALALSRAQQGKKCLLVELGNQSFYKDYFLLDGVGYQPKPLRPNLDLALWSGPDCLKEYARHLLKIESLYRLFFENPVTRSLVNVAPALPELSILGKVTSGPPRLIGPALPYDCLVVDSYATGHFLALLKAPQGMAQAVRYGPMAEQSRSIHAVICDSAITKYFVVSLPEELPVSEALELSEGIESQVHIRPQQILNRVITEPLAGAVGGSSTFQEAMRAQDDRQKNAVQRLQNYSVKTLPFVFENTGWRVVEALAEEFKKQNQESNQCPT